MSDQSTNSPSYADVVDVPMGHAATVEKVTALLKEEGFGVLTTIDAKKTLKEKIGEDIAPYTILGACNPPLAHRAITNEEAIGVLLPCNVVVKEVEPGKSRAFFTQVTALFSLVGRDDMAELADEVQSRLSRVAGKLRGLAS